MKKTVVQTKDRQQLHNNEQGFILVLSLMALVMVSLLGAWALTTTTFEIKIAGNEQIREGNFNVSEGGVHLEGANVGFTPANTPWYNISDPSTPDQVLLPPFTQDDYDPGNDMPSLPTSFDKDIDRKVSDKWPRQNLENNFTVNDHTLDYAYLVTYLHPDIPPKGYDASQFSSYKFRLNGAQVLTIELGGIKVGVKAAI
jgi:hypothetical protein